MSDPMASGSDGPADFVRAPRPVAMRLVAGRGHYDTVMEAVLGWGRGQARCAPLFWVMTTARDGAQDRSEATTAITQGAP